MSNSRDTNDTAKYLYGRLLMTRAARISTPGGGGGGEHSGIWAPAKLATWHLNDASKLESACTKLHAEGYNCTTMICRLFNSWEWKISLSFVSTDIGIPFQ